MRYYSQALVGPASSRPRWKSLTVFSLKGICPKIASRKQMPGLIRRYQTCDFRERATSAPAELGGGIQCLVKSSPYAGPSADAEVARLVPSGVRPDFVTLGVMQAWRATLHRVLSYVHVIWHCARPCRAAPCLVVPCPVSTDRTYIYIYIYMYTYVYVHICMCVYIYIYIYIICSPSCQRGRARTNLHPLVALRRSASLHLLIGAGLLGT